MQGPSVLTTPAGADAPNASVSNNVVKFAVTGTATATGVTRDQATFFRKELASGADDVVIDSTHALATVSPDISAFANADVSEFFVRRPINVRSANITAADSAGTVSSLTVAPTRITPLGEDAKDRISSDSFQNASDQLETRVTIPIGFKCDGWSFLRFTNTNNATPASYNVSFVGIVFPDPRQVLPNVPPALVKSSAR